MASKCTTGKLIHLKEEAEILNTNKFHRLLNRKDGTQEVRKTKHYAKHRDAS